MSANPDDKPPGGGAASAQHVAALTKAVEDLAGEASELRGYGQRNRHMIWGLWVSLVVDVVLTAALTVVGVQAWQANDQADQNRQNQISICQTSNTARAQNAQLWEYVLNAVPPRNDLERQRREEFRAFMRKVFAPRDCSKL